MNFFKSIAKIGLISASFSFYAMALTDSGEVIKNQAGATYLDSANISRSTTSNLVETLVNPVAAVTLISDQSKRAAPDGTVIFHHVLTNTGNSTDSFQLDFSIIDAVITGAEIYIDANQDGLIDVGTSSIASGSIIGPLAAGESYEFVIQATIDSAAVLNSTGSLTVTATSQAVSSGVSVASGGVGAMTNTDTVTITDLPIIEVTKSLSESSGPSPSGPYTVTFTYTNVGLTDMDPTQKNGLILTDTLPEGMRFNGGVNWSISGTEITTVGTTTGGSESSGTQDLSFTTCIAPDASCPNNDEIVFTMDGLASDESATVSFSVNIDSNVAATTLYNEGLYGFDEDDSGAVDSDEENTTTTNRVPFLITANYNVIANNGGCDAGTDNNCDGTDDTNHEIVEIASATQGARVSFTNYIWNTGNAEDTFNITLESSTFPAGTSFFLYKSDGVTPLIDTDNNGDADTGVIPAAGETCPAYLVFDSTNQLCGYKVILVATLPVSSLGGPYEVVKRATSSNDVSKTNTVTDRLGTIIASTVDLTNNFRAGTATTPEANCDALDDNCGFGVGAEAAAVVTNTVEPGKTTRFTLYVTNTSSVADSYVLEYSSSDFSAGSLPTGWTVEFKDANDSVINNIPVLGPDNSFQFFADVSVPDDAQSATQSIYFKAKSLSTGAFDVKHDAVTVSNANLCLTFSPLTANGVASGNSFIVYKHLISNNSNDTYNNIALTVTNSEPGFTAMVYEDTDGDDVLTAADTAIVSIPTLAGKADKVIFVKVFTPSTALEGTVNLTKVEFTLACGTSQITDSTKIANTNVNIVKEQSLDANCDGVADNGTFITTNFQVAPGQCVVYRLTTENVGINDAFNVVIRDATPSFTTFLQIGGTIPTISTGTINPINNGDVGSIIGTVGTMQPGQVETLIFGIKINEYTQ